MSVSRSDSRYSTPGYRMSGSWLSAIFDRVIVSCPVGGGKQALDTVPLQVGASSVGPASATGRRIINPPPAPGAIPLAGVEW